MDSIEKPVKIAHNATVNTRSRTNLQPGQGVITVKSTASASTIHQLSSAYPIKLISPKLWYDRRAALVFMLSYGGGLVPGDVAVISAHVHAKSRLGVLTQGSTKIYKSPSSADVSRQSLTVIVEDDAAMLIIPDPIQPFRNSVYDQYQAFYLRDTASLLMLDWVSEGRRTMGETWNFTSFKSKNEVWRLPNSGDRKDVAADCLKSRLLVRDNVRLNGAEEEYQGTLESRMSEMGIFGTLIIGGPLWKELCQFFMDEFNNQPRIGEKNWTSDKGAGHKKQEVLWSVACTRGLTIVKFGTKEVDEARRWVREMLEREGSVVKHYGQKYLLCLQDR